VNAVTNELASVDVRMSATLHPLTSSTDMTSLAEIQNTFPPYDSSDGILYIRSLHSTLAGATWVGRKCSLLIIDKHLAANTLLYLYYTASNRLRMNVSSRCCRLDYMGVLPVNTPLQTIPSKLTSVLPSGVKKR